MKDRHSDGNNDDEPNTPTMLAKFYALLTDAYALDAPIYVFDERFLAEEAMHMKGTGSASIISFNAADQLISAAHGLVYLAMSLEDTGIRIHSAFRHMFSLQYYMLGHIQESVCVAAIGWLDPVITNGTAFTFNRGSTT